MEFCLYGRAQADIIEAKSILENKLCIQMNEHNSFHWGGRYFLYEDDGKVLRVIKNWDLIDETILEEKFTEYQVLLQAESTNEEWLLQKLPDKITQHFTLLKSE